MLTEVNQTYRPFTYPWAVEMTQTHEIELHWHEKECNLQQDVQQWNDGTITDSEKEFITNVLRLFTQSDVAVGETYKNVLIPYFKNNEISNLLTSFANRESVHQRAYALIPETLRFPDAEWHAFLDYKHMKDKWDFMTEPAGTTLSDMAYTLAKQVFMEGVSLFGSFAMLLWFKQQAKMLGMCEVVEWSLRDESLHVEGEAKLFREFTHEHPRIVNDELKKRIYDIAREVIKHEDKFINKAFEIYEPDGFTADDLKQYVRFLADRRLIQLGLTGNFNVKKMPASMEWLTGITMGARDTNFFERRVTDYVQKGMTGELDWSVVI